MMKKWILLLGVLLAFLTIAFSQDKVYLKSGSVLRGKYIQSDSTSLKVNVDGNEMVIPWSIVSGIKMGNKLNKEHKGLIKKERGLIYGGKLGVLISSSSNNSPVTTSYELSAGYYWNKWLSVLGKAGVDVNGEYLSIPLGVRALSTFGYGNLKPVIIGDAGYGWSSERKMFTESDNTSLSGGLHYAAGVGISILTDNGMVLISVMGKSQTTNILYDFPEFDSFSRYPVLERKRDMRRLEIGLSYMIF